MAACPQHPRSRPLTKTASALAWIGLCTGALALPVPAHAADASAFAPTETVVSTNRGLIDFEFSQRRGKLAWTDINGNLWLAGVDRETGEFEPSSGFGQRITTGTVSNWNMFMWNGPEWLTMGSGDQLYFSYYLPDTAPLAKNTRMAVAVQDRTGAWVTHPLSPELPRMAHIASKNPGDTNAQIKYMDPDLNQYWRNVLDPSSEQLVPYIPPSTKSWRFASGLRALLYTEEVDGVPQVFSYSTDTGLREQLTFDAGAKDTGRTVPWIWQAPEFGGDFVLSTIVNASELRVYRRLPDIHGALVWTPIYSASLPDGTVAGSPEWFVYRRKSYVFMAGFVGNDEFASEIWLSNIDAGWPLIRKVTVDEPFRVRNDPEVFVTKNGPYIYYNRYDPSLDPDHPMCKDCSEGVFRAETGLKRN